MNHLHKSFAFLCYLEPSFKATLMIAPKIDRCVELQMTAPSWNWTFSSNLKNFAAKIVWPSPLQEEFPHLPWTTELLLHPNKHNKLLGRPWKAVSLAAIFESRYD